VLEILHQAVSSAPGILQGFVLHVVSRASKLDTLQHSLMHMKKGREGKEVVKFDKENKNIYKKKIEKKVILISK
jgi:hypothetical protein